MSDEPGLHEPGVRKSVEQRRATLGALLTSADAADSLLNAGPLTGSQPDLLVVLQDQRHGQGAAAQRGASPGASSSAVSEDLRCVLHSASNGLQSSSGARALGAAQQQDTSSAKHMSSCGSQSQTPAPDASTSSRALSVSPRGQLHMSHKHRRMTDQAGANPGANPGASWLFPSGRHGSTDDAEPSTAAQQHGIRAMKAEPFESVAPNMAPADPFSDDFLEDMVLDQEMGAILDMSRCMTLNVDGSGDYDLGAASGSGEGCLNATACGEASIPSSLGPKQLLGQSEGMRQFGERRASFELPHQPLAQGANQAELPAVPPQAAEPGLPIIGALQAQLQLHSEQQEGMESTDEFQHQHQQLQLQQLIAALQQRQLLLQAQHLQRKRSFEDPNTAPQEMSPPPRATGREEALQDMACSVAVDSTSLLLLRQHQMAQQQLRAHQASQAPVPVKRSHKKLPVWELEARAKQRAERRALVQQERAAAAAATAALKQQQRMQRQQQQRLAAAGHSRGRGSAAPLLVPTSQLNEQAGSAMTSPLQAAQQGPPVLLLKQVACHGRSVRAAGSGGVTGQRRPSSDDGGGDTGMAAYAQHDTFASGTVPQHLVAVKTEAQVDGCGYPGAPSPGDMASASSLASDMVPVPPSSVRLNSAPLHHHPGAAMESPLMLPPATDQLCQLYKASGSGGGGTQVRSLMQHQQQHMHEAQLPEADLLCDAGALADMTADELLLGAPQLAVPGMASLGGMLAAAPVRPSMQDLIIYDLFQPGSYTFSVGNIPDVPVEVTHDGIIVFQGKSFPSISAFALAALKSRNPNRMACDGWKEVRFNGIKMEQLRCKCIQMMAEEGAL